MDWKKILASIFIVAIVVYLGMVWGGVINYDFSVPNGSKEEPEPEPEIIYEFNRHMSVPELNYELDIDHVLDNGFVCMRITTDELGYKQKICVDEDHGWPGNPLKFNLPSDDKYIGLIIYPLDSEGNPLVDKFWEPDMLFKVQLYEAHEEEEDREILYEETI